MENHVASLELQRRSLDVRSSPWDAPSDAAGAETLQTGDGSGEAVEITLSWGEDAYDPGASAVEMGLSTEVSETQTPDQEIKRTGLVNWAGLVEVSNKSITQRYELAPQEGHVIGLEFNIQDLGNY